MSPQRSRLKIVVKVKRLLEKKAQSELIRIRTMRKQECDELERLQEQQEDVITDTSQSRRVHASLMQVHRTFLQQIERQIRDQEKKIDAIGRTEDLKREEVIQRTQSKRTVENVQQRREAEAVKEHEKKEQRVIDILAQHIRLGY